MTDNEIIKALECCKKTLCKGCPNFPKGKGILWCKEELQENALDLINRQKAEIERNREIIKYHEILISALEKRLESEKTEVIREFGKFLIDKSKNGMVSIADIPEYVKEMTEGENG